MAQMPAPAPVILLELKSLRMCARKECEGGKRGKRMTRVGGTNEARRAEGASTLRSGVARRKRRRRRRETHKSVSFVSFLIASGMVPLI